MFRAGVTHMRNNAQPARGFATEQALRERISAVKNIRKITSAMKMVAVCKLRVAQETLDASRQFSRALTEVDFKPKEGTPIKKQLYVGISSDRGLCGAINSSISRGVRDSILAGEKAGVEEAKILLIGEKSRQGLERLFKERFTDTLSETAKFRACTFKQCGELTDFWLNRAASMDVTSVFYQRFVSMISYVTTEDKFWSYDAIKDDIADEFAEYEMEGDADILQNLHEYRMSVKLYHYFAENETSTLSARMTAMDNSSNNAKDMIDELSIILNRNRQAKITTELSEIISGAAASDDAQ